MTPVLESQAFGHRIHKSLYLLLYFRFGSDMVTFRFLPPVFRCLKEESRLKVVSSVCVALLFNVDFGFEIEECENDFL